MHRFAFVLALLCSGLLVLGAPAKKTAKKQTTSTSRRSTNVHAAASRSHSSAAALAASHRQTNGKHAVAESGTARDRNRKVVVVRKKVHGRWVRVTQIVHTAPGPSYQTHPDADRYREIQQALAANGYFKGDPNGEWGDDSVDAMKRFQADHKLPTDGKISALSLIGLGLGPKRDSTLTRGASSAAVKSSLPTVTATSSQNAPAAAGTSAVVSAAPADLTTPAPGPSVSTNPSASSNPAASTTPPSLDQH